MINSAMKLAKRRKEKLVILWYLNPELNAAFEDLFQPILEPDITLINIHSLKDPRKLYYQLSAGQRFGDDDIRNNKTDDRLNDDFYRALKKRVYIFTCERFDPTKDYSLFVPTDTLQKRVDTFTRDFAPRCVGVHIRRTDNAVSMGKSTTEQFIAEMEKELTAHPETRFFLATDDQSEEELLRSRFPGKSSAINPEPSTAIPWPACTTLFWISIAWPPATRLSAATGAPLRTQLRICMALKNHRRRVARDLYHQTSKEIL